MPDKAETGNFAYDFFVSRRGSAAAVAQEVATVLKAAGYRVIVQDFDIPFSTNFVGAMHDAVKLARHFVGLLTEDYDTSPFTRAEWTSFFAIATPSGGKRRLILLRVDDIEPPGLFSPIVYGNLFGITDPKRRREIILAAAEGQSTGKRREPQLFHAVPPRNPDFVGRDALLRRLHASLTAGNQLTAVTQAAMHGLGGIGKTSIAVEYAHQYREDYAGVWWAPAERPALLLESLTELAKVLDPAFASSSADEASTVTRIQRAFDKLAQSTRPWLLIYDNVESPHAIQGLEPSAGARLLITTRYPDWRGRAQEIEVDVFQAGTAARFLLRRSGRNDRSGATQLAARLGYLPLALDHAAAYVKLAGISFERYAERLGELIQIVPKAATYPASVAATIWLALEKASVECSDAEPLLALLSTFGLDRIPLDLVDNSILTEDERDAALMALHSVSLIKYQSRPDQSPIVFVHRLVQAAMRSKVTTW